MQLQPLLSIFLPYFSSLATQRQELKRKGTIEEKNKQTNNKKLAGWVVFLLVGSEILTEGYELVRFNAV
jgi:hypothetical protein